MPQSTLLRVASLDEFRTGTMIEVEHGEQIIAVCRVSDTEILALDGVCPHAGAPLAQGNLCGDTVICPGHAWEFDCRSGENTWNSRQKLATFPVRVEAETVYVEVAAE